LAPALTLKRTSANPHPTTPILCQEGGPAAEARFEGGVAGFEARAFRGCGVVTSEPFEVSDDNESLQMLTRSSQIGEFYVMSPPQVPPKGDSMHTCDLLIYDEESDRHVRVTWEEAMEATLVGDADFYNDAAGTAMADGNDNSTKFSEWKDMADAWSTFNKGGGDYATAAGENGKNLACRIIVARPFIEHLMHNVVMTVAGRDTGATLFGPADMQLSANTQVKTIEGHYTGHFKAVVTKPQNVLIMKDVACAGYVAGMNTRWFAKPERGGAMSSEAAQENIQARLSFSHDDTDRYASMLAFPCLEGQFQSGQLDTVMSVTTRLLPWEVNNAGTHASFPGGNAMFAKYNAALQLGQVHYGEDMKAAENQDFISQGSTNNATCFLGPSRRYDPFTKSFLSLIPGQGHFGPDAIPGDARWRRGESVSLKAARDSMVPLELAQHAQMVYSAP